MKITFAFILGILAPTAFAQNSSGISISWPTPDVIMLPGVQVAIYGYVTGSPGSLSPAVAIQNNSTGLWAHSDGSWGSQQWLNASIVDSAGQWRLLYAPNSGGTFNLKAALLDSSGTAVAAAATSFQVQSSGSSPAPPTPPSSPAPPNSSTSITLAWPTPQVTMLPGILVGIWGMVTGSSAAAVSTSVQNNQNSLWLQSDGSWSAQQTWFPAPIVDSAGTWRWMYTPASGGSFTVFARVVDGSTTLQASSAFSVQGATTSTPPPPPPPPVTPPPSGNGTFPMQIVNATSGRWAMSDIWVTIIGQATPGAWAYLTPDGIAHHVDHTMADAPGHLTYGGINYPAMSFQVPSSGLITIPASFQGGRAYISLGSPLFMSIPNDDSGIALPDVNNPTDPNAGVYWDYYEFTYVYGQVAFGGDTSQVDQFGFPINVEVQQSQSGFDRSTSYLVSRDAIRNLFLNSPDADYQTLVTPQHVIAPRTSPQFLSTATSATMQSYIDQVWSSYQNGFTFAIPGQTYSGAVQADGLLHFSYQGASGYTLQKPSAGDVWQCSGALASGNSVELAMGAQFCAAFNRGVAQNTNLWWDKSQYYVGPVKNLYAQYIHSVCSDSRAYAIAYDDVNDQSTVIILPNSQPPSLVTLTVAW